MLKKRVIFTLLYDSGSFMLSRNFRLQKVGDIQWLKKNYNFSKHVVTYIVLRTYNEHININANQKLLVVPNGVLNLETG